MAEVDIPVRRNGKSYRLVTSGDHAALFDKTGVAETLTVTVAATAPMRMPELEDANGNPVQLARASRPCSCTGRPWSASIGDLRARIA